MIGRRFRIASVLSLFLLLQHCQQLIIAGNVVVNSDQESSNLRVTENDELIVRGGATLIVNSDLSCKNLRIGHGLAPGPGPGKIVFGGKYKIGVSGKVFLGDGSHGGSIVAMEQGTIETSGIEMINLEEWNVSGGTFEFTSGTTFLGDADIHFHHVVVAGCTINAPEAELEIHGDLRVVDGQFRLNRDFKTVIHGNVEADKGRIDLNQSELYIEGNLVLHRNSDFLVDAGKIFLAGNLEDWNQEGEMGFRGSSAEVYLVGDHPEQRIHRAGGRIEIKTLRIQRSSGICVLETPILVTGSFVLESGTFRIESDSMICQHEVRIEDGTLEIDGSAIWFSHTNPGGWKQNGGVVRLEGGDIHLGTFIGSDASTDYELNGGLLDIRLGKLDVADGFIQEGGELSIAEQGLLQVGESGKGDSPSPILFHKGQASLIGGRISILHGQSGDRDKPLVHFSPAFETDFRNGSIKCTPGKGTYYLKNDGKPLPGLEIGNKNGDYTKLVAVDRLVLNGPLVIHKHGELRVSEAVLELRGDFQDYNTAGNHGLILSGFPLVFSGAGQQHVKTAGGWETLETIVIDKPSGEVLFFCNATLKHLTIDNGGFVMMDDTLICTGKVVLNEGEFRTEGGHFLLSYDDEGAFVQNGGFLHVMGGSMRIGDYTRGHLEADYIMNRGKLRVENGSLEITDAFHMLQGELYMGPGGVLNISRGGQKNENLKEKFALEAGTFSMAGGRVNVMIPFTKSDRNRAIRFSNKLQVNFAYGLIVYSQNGNKNDGFVIDCAKFY